MKTSQMLMVIRRFLQLSMVLTIGMLIYFIFITVHVQFVPDKYNKTIVEVEDNSFKYKTISNLPETIEYDKWQEINSPHIRFFYFSTLTWQTRLKILLVNLFYGLFAILVIRELINVSTSLKDYKLVFYKNMLYFKRIGIYLTTGVLFKVLIGVIGIKMNVEFISLTEKHFIPDYSIRYFSIPFGFLSFIAIIWIVTLVFKEAERLRIENELTV